MIKVENLYKNFGPIRAVDGVSFEVGKGEIMGFLGPNGAGKSTTMKMITTFLSPSAGTASVGGFDIIDNPIQVRKLLGYLPESAPSYKDMKVYDFLDFVAEVRGFDGSEREKRVMKMLEMCNLKDVAYQLIDTLSKGYRQRVGFAQALLHDPDYLILDEPTDGLDPNQKKEVRDLIKSMGREKCIILSTHILEEMESVCSRAIVIADGMLVADNTPDELRHLSDRHNAVTLELANIDPWAIMKDLREIKGVKNVENLSGEYKDEAKDKSLSKDETKDKSALQDETKDKSDKSKKTGNRVKVRLYPQKGLTIARETAEFINAKGWNIEGFTVEAGDFNEVFRKLTMGGETNA
jgi:ABC-2 type transport system ATP-binding protein